MKSSSPAVVVMLAGVSAALHVGKLPPALPVLRDALQISLLQAGFLVSLVQLAGMSAGLLIGLAAGRLGLRRSLLGGLVLLGLASGAGAAATDAAAMLSLRAAEGLGFLLVVLPAPALVRALVAPQRLDRAMGWWGAYMPIGVALALLAGPPLIALLGWRAWWWILAAVSLLLAAWIWRVVPADAARLAASSARSAPPAPAVAADGLRETLRRAGPWCVALSFLAYSGQWLAVVGFLPTIYAQAGVGVVAMGLLSAFAAAVNIIGNVVAGRLLHRGWPAPRLLAGAFILMGGAGVLAFALRGAPVLQYALVLLFSASGGVIPGTLFALAVRLAPGDRAVAATVGLAQQLSATGQFCGPPLVAWVADLTGTWRATGLITGSCALVGLWLARQIGILLRGDRHAG